MNLMELEMVIKERRSIRKWQDKPVPEELLQKAIELGSWAPSGGGRQPYHFYLVTNTEKIAALAQAVQDKADLIASWQESHDDLETVKRWLKDVGFFSKAPAVVAVCAGIYQSAADNLLSRRLGDPEAAAMIQARQLASSRVQSAAAAITQMLLALHVQGLGAVWMTGPVQAKAEIEKILRIPENLDFIALIPVGYPAGEPQVPPHRPLEELVTIIR